MKGTMTDTLTRQIARWTDKTEWSDLPHDYKEVLKLRILDTVGLVISARDLPHVEMVTALVDSNGGNPESTLIGSGKQVPASWAAFTHAIHAHSQDFDDTFPDSVIHPGSIIVPVAMAAGEATGSNGREIMTAVAIGYEVAARLGRMAGRGFHSRGFHASSVIGPLAGAVTAGKLYKLTSTQITCAMGIAGSTSGGLLEFLSDASWSKWFQMGWAAHAGIIAAQLAGHGFTGPETILEGRNGLYRAFIDKDVSNTAGITEGLGEQWHGATSEFKYYPCAHVIQPYIDAALQLKASHNLAPAEISAVQCRIAPWCVPIVCEPRAQRLQPRRSLDAIASLPFMLAVALTDGQVSLDSISSRALVRSEVNDLANRIRHLEDPALGKTFDGELIISTIDGQEFSAPAMLPGLDPDRVRKKFRDNILRVADTHASKLETAIDHFADQAEILPDLFRLPAP